MCKPKKAPEISMDGSEVIHPAVSRERLFEVVSFTFCRERHRKGGLAEKTSYVIAMEIPEQQFSR